MVNRLFNYSFDIFTPSGDIIVFLHNSSSNTTNIYARLLKVYPDTGIHLNPGALEDADTPKTVYNKIY